MKEYNFKDIEQKWQNKWKDNPSLKTDYKNTDNKKYCLTPQAINFILVIGIIMDPLTHL